MTRTVFDNAGVAHVWAQNAEAAGRSHNGQFYFEGPALYSYGPHFLAGFILPDGAALLNADSPSISTGRHLTHARRAVSHRAAYVLADLGRLAQALTWAAVEGGDSRLARSRYYDKADARRDVLAYCRTHALGLARQHPAATDSQEAEARRRADLGAEAAGRQAESWGDYYARRARHLEAVQAESDTPDALAYLLGLVGLGRSRAKVLRQAEADARAKARREAQEAEAKAEAEARTLSGDALSLSYLEPCRPWAETLRWAVGKQDARGLLGNLSKRLLRAQKWAKGRRGWIKAHATLKARRAEVRAALGNLEARQARAWANRETRRAISALRPDNLARVLEGQAVSHALADYVGRGGAAAQADDSAQEGREVAALMTARALGVLAEAGPVAPSIKARARAALAKVAPAAEAAREARAARVTAAAEAREAERLERERAAREAWLAGDKAARFYGRDAQGGAYLRAVDIERDESGAITGGELQTSQGARVPLVHALRVFRFLRHCRETGQPWQRNGRTLRVGFYQVDSVDPDGTFRAGCHLIRWPQVADLAERLGVADLAPQDVTDRGAAA